MQLNIKVKKTTHYKNKIRALQQKLKKINNSKIYIGYYDDQGVHQDSGLTYVELMTIHEYGAPKANIPARPILSLTQDGGLFSPQDKTAIIEAFKGVFIKNIPVETGLNKIGLYYENKGKALFGSGALLPTVEGNPPLIGDTEQLRAKLSYRTSFTYKQG